MDRVIVYPGALPQTVDVLNTNKFNLVGQAYQNRAILGTNTVVSGLACLPTSPTADLHVSVGVGSIYQLDPTDQAAYGDLGVDNNNISKQGILSQAAILTITPPGTIGFSQVFLVQAILNDIDSGQMVLSYYNSANPAAPYAGPANSGTSNFTTRTCPCVIALKAGSAATTGTQTTPAPDAGYVGLYAVTVTNGQTQIISSNIVQLPTAPFFPTLPSIPISILNGIWVYAGQDTGTVNAYIITFIAGQAVPTAYTVGMGVKFKALVTNTGASTINVNGLGIVAIKRGNGVSLSANDIVSGGIIELTYDGTNFQMQNYLGTGTNTNTITQASIPYVADSGTANALVGTYSPVITAGQQIAGLALAIKLANTITGACTINVNGLGIKNVTLGDITAPPYNVFVSGMVLIIEYDGTQYQIVNTSAGMFYRKPTSNYTIFVNTAIGSDTNDGISNTALHALKTIQAGVNLAFSYAPSQFNITVVVEPGTYNESINWPSYSGPNITVDGLVTNNVVVSSGSTHCFSMNGPNVATIKNLTVQNNGVYANTGFRVNGGGLLTTLNTASNACGIVFGAGTGGTLQCGTHTFNGSGYVAWYVSAGGNISIGFCTLTWTAPVSYIAGTVFVGAGEMGFDNVNPPIFVNPNFVNAYKFQVGLNGVISANGLGINFLPGSLAGFTNSGGQVQF